MSIAHRTAPAAVGSGPRPWQLAVKPFAWPILGLLLPAACAAAAPPEARQQELLELLRQDCGSCHGLTLKGGLGPALLPAALEGKAAELLAAIILHGRPGTPMPPWGPLLEQDEALWLARRIKEGLE
jgi:cytochrome c55X